MVEEVETLLQLCKVVSSLTMTTSASKNTLMSDMDTLNPKKLEITGTINGQKTIHNPRKLKKVNEVTFVENRYEVLSKVGEEPETTIKQPLRVNPPPINLIDVQNFTDRITFLQSSTDFSYLKMEAPE